MRIAIVTLTSALLLSAPALADTLRLSEPVASTATTETFTFDQIADWYSSRPHQPHRLDLAIIENATGQFAGEVVLTESDAGPAQASFRISLRGPAWYGRGLGSEATALIVRHGFDVMELEQIDLEVLERNPRAHHVYEKVGFVETGRFEEEDERWVTMVITPDRAGSG